MVADIKRKLRTNQIVKSTAEKYGLGDKIDAIIDGMSIVISDITNDDGDPISGRTNDGDIELNSRFLEKSKESGRDALEYAIHEFTHVCQHIVNEGDTKKILNENRKKYLNRPNEQEAFQNQIEHIKNTEGKKDAEEYVEDLLRHHKIKPGTKKWNTLTKLLLGGKEE